MSRASSANLPADQVGQRANLAGADRRESMNRFVSHCMRPLTVYPLPFPFAAVAAEGPRRGELSQPVPDHFLGHEHLHVDLAVVDHERVPDELRHDRAGPGPRLDRAPCVPTMFCFSTFANSLGLTKGPFFSDLPIVLQPSAYLIFNWPYRRDRRRRTIALEDGFLSFAGESALGQLAGGADRMAAALGAAFAAAVGMVDGVHRRAADVRPAAHPALAPRLAEHDAHVVGVAQSCRWSPGRRPARGGFRRWAG